LQDSAVPNITVQKVKMVPKGNWGGSKKGGEKLQTVRYRSAEILRNGSSVSVDRTKRGGREERKPS